MLNFAFAFSKSIMIAPPGWSPGSAKTYKLFAHEYYSLDVYEYLGGYV
jgi:hypothetical protein